jgi:hypothetical protein
MNKFFLSLFLIGLTYSLYSMQDKKLKDLILLRNKHSNELTVQQKTLKVFEKHNDANGKFIKEKIEKCKTKINLCNNGISKLCPSNIYFPYAEIFKKKQNLSKELEVYSKPSGNLTIIRVPVVKQKGMQCLINSVYYSGLLEKKNCLEDLLKAVKNEEWCKLGIQWIVSNYEDTTKTKVRIGLGWGVFGTFFTKKNGYDLSKRFKISADIDGVERAYLAEVVKNNCRACNKAFELDLKPKIVLIGVRHHSMAFRLEYDALNDKYYVFLIDSWNNKLGDNDSWTTSLINVVTKITGGKAKIS